MTSFSLILAFVVYYLTTQIHAKGINCGGSALCLLATVENAIDSIDVIQAFRTALKYTDLPSSTVFSNGEHIICLSNTLTLTLGPNVGPVRLGFSFGIHTGGICMFPENMPAGTGVSLAQARAFTDEILGHGCDTCGAVPVNWPATNDVTQGSLKIDYVEKPICIDNCIWEGNHQGAVAQSVSATATATATAAATTGAKSSSTAAVVATSSLLSSSLSSRLSSLSSSVSSLSSSRTSSAVPVSTAATTVTYYATATSNSAISSSTAQYVSTPTFTGTPSNSAYSNLHNRLLAWHLLLVAISALFLC